MFAASRRSLPRSLLKEASPKTTDTKKSQRNRSCHKLYLGLINEKILIRYLNFHHAEVHTFTGFEGEIASISGSQAQVDFVGSTPLQEGAQWSPVPSPSCRGFRLLRFSLEENPVKETSEMDTLQISDEDIHEVFPTFYVAIKKLL